MHAASIKPWGGWIPCAWPHDGLQHDKGSGEQLASLYKDQGLNTLPERATFEDGGNGVEAGVIEMLDRMQTGRFKVFSHLKEWFDEFRLYHRKDGKIVKERDDLLSATPIRGHDEALCRDRAICSRAPRAPCRRLDGRLAHVRSIRCGRRQRRCRRAQGHV
jgi:hypothetical protein